MNSFYSPSKTESPLPLHSNELLINFNRILFSYPDILEISLTLDTPQKAGFPVRSHCFLHNLSNPEKQLGVPMCLASSTSLPRDKKLSLPFLL